MERCAKQTVHKCSVDDDTLHISAAFAVLSHSMRTWTDGVQIAKDGKAMRYQIIDRVELVLNGPAERTMSSIYIRIEMKGLHLRFTH